MQGGRGGHNGLDRGNAWNPGIGGTKNFSKSWTKDVDGRPLLSEEDGEGAPLLNVYPQGVMVIRLDLPNFPGSRGGDRPSHT